MIRKVRPWSVLKVSFFFYLCVWAVIVGAVVILYGMLGAIGALDSIDGADPRGVRRARASRSRASGCSRAA